MANPLTKRPSWVVSDLPVSSSGRKKRDVPQITDDDRGRQSTQSHPFFFFPEKKSPKSHLKGSADFLSVIVCIFSLGAHITAIYRVTQSS